MKPLYAVFAFAIGAAELVSNPSVGAPSDDALAGIPSHVEAWVFERKTAKTWVITNWLEEPSGIGCAGGDRPLWEDYDIEGYIQLLQAGKNIYRAKGSSVTSKESTPTSFSAWDAHLDQRLDTDQGFFPT